MRREERRCCLWFVWEGKVCLFVYEKVVVMWEGNVVCCYLWFVWEGKVCLYERGG